MSFRIPMRFPSTARTVLVQGRSVLAANGIITKIMTRTGLQRKVLILLIP